MLTGQRCTTATAPNTSVLLVFDLKFSPAGVLVTMEKHCTAMLPSNSRGMST